MISLGVADSGRIVIGTSGPLDDDVATVECYLDERLIVLTFENCESRLMPLEFSEQTALIIEAAPPVAVIAVAIPGEKPYGYEVPLVRTGGSHSSS